LKLVYNEQFKIYISKSTWIMYIILTAIIIGGAVIVSVFGEDLSKPTGDDWREELQAENEAMEKENENVGEDEGLVVTINNDIITGIYGAWKYDHENAALPSVVCSMTITIVACISANQFRW